MGRIILSRAFFFASFASNNDSRSPALATPATLLAVGSPYLHALAPWLCCTHSGSISLAHFLATAAPTFAFALKVHVLWRKDSRDAGNAQLFVDMIRAVTDKCFQLQDLLLDGPFDMHENGSADMNLMMHEMMVSIAKLAKRTGTLRELLLPEYMTRTPTFTDKELATFTDIGRHLTSLKIPCAFHLNDEQYQFIIESCPLLQQVAITHTDVTSMRMPKRLRELALDGVSTVEAAKDVADLWKNISDLVYIEKMTAYNLKCPAAALEVLLNGTGLPCLRILRLQYSGEFTAQSLTILCKAAPGLRELDLSQCLGRSSDDGAPTPDLAEQRHELDGLLLLDSLQNLDVSSTLVHDLSAVTNCSALTDLCISSAPNLTARGVLDALRRCPLLEYVNFASTGIFPVIRVPSSSSSSSRDDAYLTELRETLVGVKAMFQLLAALPELRNLVIMVDTSSDDVENRGCEYGIPLPDFNNNDFAELSLSSIFSELRFSPKLATMSVKLDIGFDDAALLALARAVPPTLDSLGIVYDGCKCWTPAGLREALRLLPKLTSLTLDTLVRSSRPGEEPPRVVDGLFEAIDAAPAEGGKRAWETLHFEGIVMDDDDEIAAMLQLPSLKQSLRHLHAGTLERSWKTRGERGESWREKKPTIGIWFSEFSREEEE